MPRISRKTVLAELQDPAAPFLFDESNLPVKPMWVEAIRAKEITGARLLDDLNKVQRMVDLLCLGNGVKKVARFLHVSPHSVRAARAVLVEQGKLAPFRARFVQRAEELVEDGIEKIHESIENGKLHPNFMSSAVGTIYDKRALALGEPTTISVGASVKLQPAALAVKVLNDWAAALPADLESIGKPSNDFEIEASNTIDASFDANGIGPRERQAEDGGGGDAAGGAGENTDG
jgi:hypothetical protein